MKTKEFVYGNYRYDYELLKQDRKTLSLTVRPDMGIIVKCPHHAEDERIDQFLKRKWFWLTKQLRFFEKFQKKVYKREYISGESFMYLGRQYTLLVRRGKKRVVLDKGKLLVYTDEGVSNGQTNKKLLEEWFAQRAKVIFEQRLNEVFERFDYPKAPQLVIRKMDKRWGSFIGDHKIILNPRLIESSKDCIDYVITHELCHIRYRNHDKRFYGLLKAKMPDWEKRKMKLEGILVK